MRLADYIDTAAAARAVLRDWNNQLFKADCGRDRITELDAKLGARVSRADKPRVSGGGGAGDAVAARLDKRELAKKGYQLARDFLDELEPAWRLLTDEERLMLTARYVDRDEGRGVEKIMDALYIGKTEAYRRSDLALGRLAELLFW